MTFKEIFGEEIASKVEAIAKEKGINLILDSIEKPEYIQKSKLDEISGQKDQALAQVTELNKQIGELKKSAKGNEELTKEIEKLQGQNQEWEGKYKNTILESAIKFAAVKSKAKDPGDVLAFIDKSTLEVNADGSIKGLDEQLEGLTKSKTYLFEETQPPAGSGANPAGGSGNAAPKTYEDVLKEYYSK